MTRTCKKQRRYPTKRKLERTRLNSDEAGATPPFDAPCVTASVGSLPPQSRAVRDHLAASQSRSFRVVRQRPLHSVREKARTRIKAPQYNPRRRPSQVHDEQGIERVSHLRIPGDGDQRFPNDRTSMPNSVVILVFLPVAPSWLRKILEKNKLSD
jgi:hypothetical protein